MGKNITKRLILMALLTLGMVSQMGCATVGQWIGMSHKLDNYTYFNDSSCKGYGAVNHWHKLNASEQAEIVAKNDVDVYHIEFFGWASSRVTDLGYLKDKYSKLLKECRQRNVVLFVSVLNDNSHLSKYGNTPWRPSLSYLLSALDIILQEGNEGVIIQPVAETQTSVGSQFESQGRARLAANGFQTCYNRGSRPSAPPGGWTYAAYHPTSTSSTIPSRAVCVTDTGAILNQLGGYDKFNSDSVSAYANKVLNGWHRPIVLYGFLHGKIDEPSVEALGNVQ